MSRHEDVAEAARRRPIYLAALNALKRTFRHLEPFVGPPVETEIGGRPTFRYSEQGFEQAILLKFARLINLLTVTDLMMEHGHVQEQGILQRVIDETNEDILFLGLAVLRDSRTELHEQYLNQFWLEDYEDASRPVQTRIPRGQVKRRKIRAYLNRLFDQPNPSDADAVGALLHSAYSGFVHGAAPHLMELFDEKSRRFMLSGIARNIRRIDYILDAQNVFYRALMSGLVVSKALGGQEALEDVSKALARFRAEIGIDNLEKS